MTLGDVFLTEQRPGAALVFLRAVGHLAMVVEGPLNGNSRCGMRAFLSPHDQRRGEKIVNFEQSQQWRLTSCGHRPSNVLNLRHNFCPPNIFQILEKGRFLDMLPGKSSRSARECVSELAQENSPYIHGFHGFDHIYSKPKGCSNIDLLWLSKQHNYNYFGALRVDCFRPNFSRSSSHT